MHRSVLLPGAFALCLAPGMAAAFPQAAPGGQDKKTEPAAAGQQDRVDIAGILDSWYKVTQGELHVGHVHEVFQRVPAGGPWRYNYDVDAELEMMIPDPKEPNKKASYIEALRIKAKLDDTYAPVNLQRADHKNGIDVSSTVIAEESGRKIEVVLGPTDRRVFPVAPDEEVHYSRFLMFLSLRQNGNLSKPGTRRALLFSPREDEKSPIAEVTLEIHDMVKREYLGKKDVAVTRVTYIKPPPATTRDRELFEVFVDKYGRIVEESTRGGLTHTLVRGELEAVGGDTRIRQGARRDPFRKDIPMNWRKGPEGGEGGEKGGPTVIVTVDSFAESLKTAQKLLDDLRKAKDDKREAEGDVIYEKILDYWDGLRKALQMKQQDAVVVAQVDALRKQAEEIWGGLARLVKRLQVIYLQVDKHFEREECAEMEKGIAELKKAQTRKELQDTEELLKLGSWIGELDTLVVKCRTRQELGRKRLMVTGTVIHDDNQFIAVDATVSIFGHQVGAPVDVKFMKPNRMAVVNEKMYRVGDVVDGEGVRVEKIWAHGIQVSLREETRDVPLRQN